jgi:phosphatidate phosphatase APP1
MPSRPFIAARVDKSVNKWIEQAAHDLGWRDSVIGYTGYGSTEQLRILGRIVLTPRGRLWPRDRRDWVWRDERGWRNFLSVAGVDRPARLSVGRHTIEFTADRDGYIDVRVRDHGLTPGWHSVTIETDESGPVQARVVILNDNVNCGIVSDIDDTILATHLPRPLIAAWNSLVVTESARLPVPGMAQLYRALLRRHPGAPIWYASTGSWTTLPFVERFTLRHGFPTGPVLLSDWGPTNVGWFRSGVKHKLDALESLARDFPHIRWWLVGDDGQHDPTIYADFAQAHPDQVAGIVIRELNPVEQVLAHGTFRELDRVVPGRPAGVPEFRGPDGRSLWNQIEDYLERTAEGRRRPGS